jgi:hypothetical protein
MHAIVLAAPRYGKSSRGTPRLRRPLVTLHGALRLAVLTKALNSHRFQRADTQGAGLGQIPSFSPSIGTMSERNAMLLPVAASCGFLVRLDWPALTPALIEIRLFVLET